MPAQEPSEQSLYDLCTKGFFSLWSYLNPLRQDGSELCDILVRFEKDLIIFSVKNIILDREVAASDTALKRWKKRAIDKSVRQILGAERHLLQRRYFTVKATPAGELLDIKDIDRLRIHRVAICLGSGGRIPISSSRQKDRFTHVLTDHGIDILFRELDTISDFVGYLAAREEFLATRCQGLVYHGEGDLLTLYLKNNRSFPDCADGAIVYVEGGAYGGFVQSPEYKAKKDANQFSYLVDTIIQHFVECYNMNSLVKKEALENHEMALAVLASQDRLDHRGLARSLLDIGTAKPPVGAYASRMYLSDRARTLYVIAAVPRAFSREQRYDILQARCHVAIGLLQERLDELRAIGIATELHDETGTHSYDLLYYMLGEWGKNEQQAMDRLRRDLGIWTRADWVYEVDHEYPSV